MLLRRELQNMFRIRTRVLGVNTPEIRRSFFLQPTCFVILMFVLRHNKFHGDRRLQVRDSISKYGFSLLVALSCFISQNLIDIKITSAVFVVNVILGFQKK